MPTWNTDAQLADSIDERFLATNPQIDNFLSEGVHGKFLLVAAKGMGKTLLLRHKRKQIDQTRKDYFLIPRNATADYVNLPASPSKGLIELMQTKPFWEDVWTISIAISVLLNFPHKLSEAERDSALNEIKRADIPTELAQELVSAFSERFTLQRSPSSVLNIFLQGPGKAIEKARSRGLQVVTELFNKYISSGCAVFIDSFDQALGKVFPDNLDIWCNGQVGLLKAAWELSRHNRHVKIYATIRQEAFAYFDDPEINNIKGSMLLIEYSKDDLEAIFSKAINHYEGISSIEEFIGLTQVYNGYLRIREPIFDYICRHTINVPRWLMIIGEKISTARPDRGVIKDPIKSKQQQKKITGIVNLESSTLASNYLMAEMSPFFKGDTPEKYIDGILGKIGSTVLSLANLRRISEKFIEQGWIGTKHPFCLMYNLGLLGYVAKTAEVTATKQKFKKPYEFDWNYECVLPKDPNTYYLIHPAIHHLIQTKNYGFKYNHVRIGDGLPWGKKEITQVQSEKIRIFISYAHHNSDAVRTIVDVIEQYLSEKSVLHDIWFDEWKMKAGKWFQDQMIEGLSNSDYLILIVSKESLDSNAVAFEWKSKFTDKITSDLDTVFPFILDDTPTASLPEYLKNIHSYSYKDSKSQIVRLVDDILFWKAEGAQATNANSSPPRSDRAPRKTPSKIKKDSDNV